MRPTGSPEELERRRLRALALLEEGLLPSEVARRAGVDRRSVRRWKAAARKDGEAECEPAPRLDDPRSSLLGTSAVWRRCSSRVRWLRVSTPTCGPVRVWPSSSNGASGSTTTSIMSGDCCMTWVGVRRNLHGAPLSATSRRSAVGSERTGRE
jgi:hypothetical protein